MNGYFYSTLYNGCNYLSKLGLKLNHVRERENRKLAEKGGYEIVQMDCSGGEARFTQEASDGMKYPLRYQKSIYVVILSLSWSKWTNSVSYLLIGWFVHCFVSAKTNLSLEWNQIYFTDNALGDLDYNNERYCLRLLTEYKNGIKIYQEWSSGLCLKSLLEKGLNRFLMSAHLVAVRCNSNFESRNFKHVKTKQKSTLEFKMNANFQLGKFYSCHGTLTLSPVLSCITSSAENTQHHLTNRYMQKVHVTCFCVFLITYKLFTCTQ